MISDLSVRAHTLAAQFLEVMTLVSPKFLQQTLEKKFISNRSVSPIRENALHLMSFQFVMECM